MFDIEYEKMCEKHGRLNVCCRKQFRMKILMKESFT